MNWRLSGMLMILAVSQISCKPMKEKADILVVNAHVYTVDAHFKVAEAFAVSDGLFLEVGLTQDILSKYESDHIIDAGGNAVYPGFMDGHCHFYGYGENLYRWADLSACKSFTDVLDTLEAHLVAHPSEWLLGRGWDHNNWDPAVFPDNERLETRFPEKKVLLIRIDGHASVASKAALQAAGIDAGTRVAGGEVVLKNGKPTGLLIDNADLAVKALIPKMTPEEQQNAIREAQQNCFTVGLTSVVDAGLPVEIIELYRSMQAAGSLKMKINAMINPDEATLQTYLPQGPYADDRLRINTVKMFADGALGSRGALMLEPYSDAPGTRGLMLYDPDFYANVCEQAYEAGFQVSVHAIGDAANRFVLDLYSDILKGPNDRRWRIEHAQIVHPDDFEKFGVYQIIPSIQSTHATSDMLWAVHRLGDERLAGAYAQQKLLAQNGWLINGTDFPIEGINPLHTFYTAVARKDLNGLPEAGFLPEEALSRREALKSMTLWVAKGSFEEDLKGSIETGKHADFVMLDRDILSIPEAEILDARVLSTFVHGERVYQHP